MFVAKSIVLLCLVHRLCRHEPQRPLPPLLEPRHDPHRGGREEVIDVGRAKGRARGGGGGPAATYSEIERQDAAAGLRATRRTRRRAASSVAAAAAGSASPSGLDGPAASSTGVVDPDEDPEEDFGGFRRRCQSMGVTLREVQTGKRFVGQI